MTTPLGPDAAAQLLAGLGSTPAQIAENLAAQGVTGTVNRPCGCPISTFLAAHGAVEPMVTKTYICVRADDSRIPVPYWVDLPAAVRDFITLFDQGVFPQLITSTTQVAA